MSQIVSLCNERIDDLFVKIDLTKRCHSVVINRVTQKRRTLQQFSRYPADNKSSGELVGSAADTDDVCVCNISARERAFLYSENLCALSCRRDGSADSCRSESAYKYIRGIDLFEGGCQCFHIVLPFSC